MRTIVATEIETHIDGQHCGDCEWREYADDMIGDGIFESCQYCYLYHIVLEEDEEELALRCNTCLAGQKDIVWQIFPKDKPVHGYQYAVINEERDGQQDFIAIAEKQGWEHCLDCLCQISGYQDGDQFCLVPHRGK